MSAYSMASKPANFHPLARASASPKADRQKVCSYHSRASVCSSLPNRASASAHIASANSLYVCTSLGFMPDLLWSVWDCLATPTLPPDASGSLLAATVTPSALPALQPHFSSHLQLPVAGPRRQGAHA